MAVTVRFSKVHDSSSGHISYTELELPQVTAESVEEQTTATPDKNLPKVSLGNRIRIDYPHFPAVLLLLCTISSTIVFMYLHVVVIFPFTPNKCSVADFDVLNPGINAATAQLVQNLFIFVLYPVTGWLADTIVGRFKVIYASIWLQWMGMIVLTLGSLLSYYPNPCDSWSYYVGKYGLLPVAILIISIGISCFYPNIVALVMDQLEDISCSKLSSFIRWFVWSFTLGSFFGYLVFVPFSFDSDIIFGQLPAISVGIFLLSSMVVITIYYTQNLFMKPSLKKNFSNPYKNVFGVVAFVMRHKVPTNRSAFTYWDNENPKRVDLAKEQYGGPYTNENVEDVKTFLRIVSIIVSFGFFFLSYSVLYSETIPFTKHLKYQDRIESKYWVVYFIDPLIAVIGIPVLEVIVLPLFPKFEFVLNKHLRWMFAGMTCLIASLISFTILDLVVHLVYKQTFCFLDTSLSSTNFSEQSISFWFVSIPSLLWGCTDFFFFVSVYCFLCCQVPYNMRGMLLGFFLFFQQVSITVGVFIPRIFTKFKKSVPISCGFWYLTSMTIVACVGLIVFGSCASFYKKRQRQEILDHREVIAEIYDREFDERDKTVKEIMDRRRKRAPRPLSTIQF